MSDYVPLELETLLEPLDERQPAGFFDPEDETFQAIDQEMIKLGGLHETRMDWAYIDEASRQYLAHQCKHFRVAGHLITACLRVGTWVAWADAVGLLAGMVELYWEGGQPKPGATGYPAKRRLVAQWLDRLGEALAGLDSGNFARDCHDAAQAALDQLQASAATAQLDVKAITSLEARFMQRAETARIPAPTMPATPAPSPGQRGGQAISEEFFSAGGGLKLGNERETRRSLLTVAEHVNQHDAYDPTGYQLRRFALWAHLHAAPSVRHEQRTELMGVPVDIVDGYQEALVGNTVNPVLLQRVEKSVESSPYWIRGSFLAAGMAARLDMREVAEAIRSSTERFVRRIPTLTELRFNDGRPFIDSETQGWLSGAATAEGDASPVQEYAGLREELVAQLDSEGVEVVLRRLQDMQTSFDAPRQRCYVSVIAADLLASRGLSWLAKDLYANVERTMRATPADQWEPALYAHLILQLPASIVIESGRKGTLP